MDQTRSADLCHHRPIVGSVKGRGLFAHARIGLLGPAAALAPAEPRWRALVQQRRH